MTIGKRKGYTAKGAGAQPGNEATKKVGGSLSKSDHFYLQEAFGVGADPGAAPQPWVASGGIVSDYVEPGPGNVSGRRGVSHPARCALPRVAAVDFRWIATGTDEWAGAGEHQS